MKDLQKGEHINKQDEPPGYMPIRIHVMSRSTSSRNIIIRKVTKKNVAVTSNMSHDDKDLWNRLRYGVPPLRLNADGGLDGKS
ncbi:MAG: hypothetical protein WBZ36_04235 [Candidatus Nitrosopolaris sp.]